MLIYKGQIFRKNMKLTQKELAAMCGVSVNTISSIERGTFLPTIELCFKLALALNVPNVLHLFDTDDDYPASLYLEQQCSNYNA